MTETSKRPLRVFLCHAKADKPAVRILYKHLTADGVDTWLDEEKLTPGQNWRMEIPKAVRKADAVIICLSEESITKEGYVQAEIKFALDIAKEKPPSTIFVIPARLEECQVPDELADFHWVDLFFDGKSFNETGYQKLLHSLQIRANKVGALLPDHKGFQFAFSRPKPNHQPIKKIQYKPKVASIEKPKPADEIPYTQLASEEANPVPTSISLNPSPKKQKTSADLKKTFLHFVAGRTIKVIALSVLACVILFFSLFEAGKYYEFINTDNSITTESLAVSDLFTSTDVDGGQTVYTFSKDQQIYVSFNPNHHVAATYESKWYYVVNFFGNQVNFSITTLTYTATPNNNNIYFELHNPKISGNYRVDVYRDQILVGRRFFSIK